jgi:Transcriptional regulator, AbiEi antitoxin
VQQQDGEAAGAGRRRTPEDVIAHIASRAHGVVTRAELRREGISAEQIRQRMAKGSLIAVHRGVYRVGHYAPSTEARYLAAVKACGDRAVLCGLAAAFLWRLIKGSSSRPEVMAPVKRRVPGVITHKTLTIEPSEVTVRNRIPITAVARTLTDIASSLSESRLARACHEAEVLYDTTPDDVEDVLARRPGNPGARNLRRILHGETPVTLSRLESRFLERLTAAKLPLPQTNCPAGGRYVDCRWPAHMLTVELDSYRYHRSRHAWERDRLREREARSRGDEFRRYTSADVFEDPNFMLAELRSLLGIATLTR